MSMFKKRISMSKKFKKQIIIFMSSEWMKKKKTTAFTNKNKIIHVKKIMIHMYISSNRNNYFIHVLFESITC